MYFKNTFKNKKVLVTGHTGFKGSWLVEWLNILGANVYGISKNIPTIPSHFKILKKSGFMQLKFLQGTNDFVTSVILAKKNN